jgi:hypothetical protein
VVGGGILFLAVEVWGTMPARFNIFRIEPEEPVWVGATYTLEQAKELTKGDKTSAKCEFCIIDQLTGVKHVVHSG